MHLLMVNAETQRPDLGAIRDRRMTAVAATSERLLLDATFTQHAKARYMYRALETSLLETQVQSALWIQP